MACPSPMVFCAMFGPQIMAGTGATCGQAKETIAETLLLACTVPCSNLTFHTQQRLTLDWRNPLIEFPRQYRGMHCSFLFISPSKVAEIALATFLCFACCFLKPSWFTSTYTRKAHNLRFQLSRMQVSLCTLLIFLTSCIVPVQAAPLADRMDRCQYTIETLPYYCAGTEINVTLLDTYVCGDKRLGPVKLPDMPPLDTLLVRYDRFGGLCPGLFLESWWNSTTGKWNYPEQEGFSLDYTNDRKGRPIYGNLTLPINTLIDRFGTEYGKFFSPASAPYMQRALPPESLDTPQDNPK